MCIFPMFSQKRISRDCVLEFACWFRKCGQWRIREVPGKMISMLRIPDNANGRDAGDLAFRKLSNANGGSYKKAIKSEPFVLIYKKNVILFTGSTFFATKWEIS